MPLTRLPHRVPPTGLRATAGSSKMTHAVRASHRPVHVVLRHRLCGGGHRPGPIRHHVAAAVLLAEGADALGSGDDQRLRRDLRPALGHQTGLGRDIGFRAVVRLSAMPVPGAGEHRRGFGLRLGRDARHGGHGDPGAHHHRLRHGNLQHAVRRAAGRNRPEKQQQRQFREPAMALVQHRTDDHHATGRLSDRGPLTDRCHARGGRARRRRAARHHRRSLADP
jgi:hypothetical protein